MKPIFTLAIENEDYDIAFIPKTEEAEQAIRDKAGSKGQSLEQYFRNEGMIALMFMESAEEVAQ
jgi:hypothetical protein